MTRRKRKPKLWFVLELMHDKQTDPSMSLSTYKAWFVCHKALSKTNENCRLRVRFRPGSRTAHNCLLRTAVKSIGWSNLGYGQSPWSDIISKYLKGTTRGQILEYGKLIRPHICHKSSRTCKFKRATRAYRLCYKHQRPYYECRYAL